jgi:MtN3 and saliva related transmembrane protein
MVLLEKSISMIARWMIESIGSAAGFCTTISLLPQLYKIWSNKSARDLSPAMFMVFGLGILFWLLYGVFARSPSVIVANSATLVLVIAILTLARRYNPGSDKIKP